MPKRLLTDLELMILLAVLRAGDHAYVVPVARDIEDTTGRVVTRAAIYTALERLESRDLVSSRLGEPTAERGGKAKRYFALTRAGLASVRATQRAFTAMWRGVPELKGQA